jgi:hypothetical protein
MMLELAVLADYAADDEARAAELLVLQRAYPSTEEAQAALGRVRRDLHQRRDAKLPRGGRWQAVKRMALLLGLLGFRAQAGPDPHGASVDLPRAGVSRRAGAALDLGAVHGRGHATEQLGDRRPRHAFYAHDRAIDVGATARAAPSIRVPIFGTVLRTVALVVLPVVVAVLALAFGVGPNGGRLLTAGLLFVAVSAVSTVAWFGYRAWRGRARGQG